MRLCAMPLGAIAPCYRVGVLLLWCDCGSKKLGAIERHVAVLRCGCARALSVSDSDCLLASGAAVHLRAMTRRVCAVIAMLVFRCLPEGPPCCADPVT